MKKMLLVVVGMFLAGTVYGNHHIPGYVTDGNGKLVHDGFGHCVKTGTWTPELAIAECHPELVKKAVVPAPTTPVAESTPEVKPIATPAPAVVAQLPAAAETLPTVTVFFQFDKSDLSPVTIGELDRFSAAVYGKKYRGVTVFGYTDQIGTKKHNAKLSAKRAAVVKKYLEDRGVTNVTPVAGGVLELKTEKCLSTKLEDLKVCYRHDRRANVVLN